MNALLQSDNGLRVAFGWADRAIAGGLAMLLVVAAGLKAFGGEGLVDSPLGLELLVFIEIAAALMLLFQRNRCSCRMGVAALFFVFGLFAVRAAMKGQPSCECLGTATVWPGWLAGVDAFASVWLLAGIRLAARKGREELTGGHSADGPIGHAMS